MSALRKAAAGTLRRELAVLQHCLEIARSEWGILLADNPVRQIKIPSPNRGRERRAKPDEIAALMTACGKTRTAWSPAAIQMAIETGIMCRSEILGLRWSEVDLCARKARLSRTKNGYPRTVPLSATAVQIPRVVR